MPPRAPRTRNWRLEAVAWIAAIALVIAALAFSGGDEETPASPDADTPPEAPAEAGTPLRP